MFFGFSEEEKMVQKSVKDMLEKHCSTEYVRKFMENPVVSETLKEQFAQLGLLGILEPNEEKVNGVTYAILIAQEAGRALLPYPLIENLTGLYALKTCQHHDELIREVEEGKSLLTVAWRSDHAVAAKANEGYLLSGTLTEVPFAEDANKVVASVRISGSGFSPEEEETIVVIDRNHSAVRLRKRDGFDETYPLYDVTLNDYPLASSDIVKGAGMGTGRQLMKKMKQLGALLLASEMAGASERAMVETVEYTKQRKQFGVEIARFQALKHMAADMYLLVESTKSAVEYAAWALEAGDQEAELAVSIAKSYASKASKKVTADAIQMHGGIGFTWESDMHLFFKRATRSAALLGDAYEHNEKIAQMVID